MIELIVSVLLGVSVQDVQIEPTEPIRDFRVTDMRRLDVVTKTGFVYGVPICSERRYEDKGWWNGRVSLALTNATCQQVLSELLKDMPEYAVDYDANRRWANVRVVTNAVFNWSVDEFHATNREVMAFWVRDIGQLKDPLGRQLKWNLRSAHLRWMETRGRNIRITIDGTNLPIRVILNEACKQMSNDGTTQWGWDVDVDGHMDEGAKRPQMPLYIEGTIWPKLPEVDRDDAASQNVRQLKGQTVEE